MRGRGLRPPTGLPWGGVPRGRADDPQLPGDWYCTECGNQNYAIRNHCHNWRCKAARDPRAAEVALPANAWRCEECGLVVYVNARGCCPRCETPGEPMGAAGVQPEVLAQAAGRPARVDRPGGEVHGGDAPLVGFLLRLLRGQRTPQHEERHAEQLLVRGDRGHTWVYVTALATYWEPFSRQRQGLRDLEDTQRHVQTVVAAAADHHRRRLFDVDFGGRGMHLRRFRLARPGDIPRGSRLPEVAIHELHDPGELQARGSRGTEGWQQRAPQGEDEHMQRLQERIQQEMRQNFLMDQPPEEPQGDQQLALRDDAPQEHAGQQVHLGGLAPPVLQAEEERLGEAEAHAAALGVRPCYYYDFRRLGRGEHSPDSQPSSTESQ